VAELAVRYLTLVWPAGLFGRFEQCLLDLRRREAPVERAQKCDDPRDVRCGVAGPGLLGVPAVEAVVVGKRLQVVDPRRRHRRQDVSVRPVVGHGLVAPVSVGPDLATVAVLIRPSLAVDGARVERVVDRVRREVESGSQRRDDDDCPGRNGITDGFDGLRDERAEIEAHRDRVGPVLDSPLQRRERGGNQPLLCLFGHE